MQGHYACGNAGVLCEQKHTRVSAGSVRPLLAVSWLYWGWLLIKPFHGGNFHTAVNSVRWLKAAQFVVQSLCYSSLLIFFKPLKQEAAHSKLHSLKCPTLSISQLSRQQVFDHLVKKNLIPAKPQVSCHVNSHCGVSLAHFLLFLLILSS